MVSGFIEEKRGTVKLASPASPKLKEERELRNRLLKTWSHNYTVEICSNEP